MKSDEFVKSGVYNGHMYNVGLDDYGQQYFIEYMDIHGQLIEEGCGAYNFDYNTHLEYLFGTPEECEHYDHPKFNEDGCCRHFTSHGYCSRCPNALPRKKQN